LRVVLVAEESAGVQTLHGLAALAPALEIVAVLTTQESHDRRRTLVGDAARRLGLATLPAALVQAPEFARELADVDLLLNVHSLYVVHADVVAAPRIGSFNLHPGPLPEYAGLNVPSWAIYNGERGHGVTLHWMDPGIDSGPVAWIDRFDLTENDTGLSVTAQCVRRGVPLVLSLVEHLTADPATVPRIEQERERRRYFDAGPPNGGRLDWAASALDVSRFVRAADYAPFPSPWGHPRARLGEHEVGIAKVTLTGQPATEPPGSVTGLTVAGAAVATGDELVVVQRIELGGRYVKATDLLA
jgi:methionyl-tRNA formyltransferase